MEIVALLFQQNMIMAVYLLIGYLLYKKGMITTQGSGEMGKLLLYVIMPTAIVRSYMKEFTPAILKAFLVSAAAAAAALLLAVLVSTLLFGRRSGIRQFGAAFSNAGFIGIPLVQMTLGEDAVLYVATFVALLNILQWTLGVYMMTRDSSMIVLRRLATNPVILSFFIGLLVFFLPVQVPSVLSGIIGTLASMNGPVAMIVLGTYLAQIPLKSLFTDPMTYSCTAVRILLIPALTMLAFCLIPAEFTTVKLAVLLAAAAPVGSNVSIFAQLFHQDYTDAVKDVCLSTILSIVSLPVVLGVANYIW